MVHQGTRLHGVSAHDVSALRLSAFRLSTFRLSVPGVATLFVGLALLIGPGKILAQHGGGGGGGRGMMGTGVGTGAGRPDGISKRTISRTFTAPWPSKQPLSSAPRS
jgi:hypothetical protein